MTLLWELFGFPAHDAFAMATCDSDVWEHMTAVCADVAERRARQ